MVVAFSKRPFSRIALPPDKDPIHRSYQPAEQFPTSPKYIRCLGRDVRMRTLTAYGIISISIKLADANPIGVYAN